MKGLYSSFLYRGKISARKLTVFIAFTLLNIDFIMSLWYFKTVSETLVIIYAVIILIGLGFLTSENVVQILKRNNDYPYYPYGDNTNIQINNKKKDETDLELPGE